VSLPVAPPESLHATELSAPGPRGTPGGRVLIVDDDPLVGKAARRILSVQHQVQLVENATEALALIRRGENFDVVLCDLLMPQVTGMELYAQLMAIDPSWGPKMIFASGGAFTQGSRQFLDSISNLRIEKPFESNALLAIVNQLFQTQGAQGVEGQSV
jgi:CheY-like chemotaxis protein